MHSWSYEGSGIDFTRFNEYTLCCKWGCTPSQLRREKYDDVQFAMQCMSVEGEANEIKQRELENRH